MSYAALKYQANPPDPALPAAAVRRWLHGRWALLFSHPDDFAAYGFESDRWLVHVQEAFAATDIRPLALAGRNETNWVLDVGGCLMRSTAFDVTARSVMTLDASLRLRRTFVYTQHDRLPSPMDLAALAREVRDSSRLTPVAARGTPAIPCRR
jgi:hypothetical protein